jgi:hypothetical protein
MTGFVMNGQPRDLLSVRLALLGGASLLLAACSSTIGRLPLDTPPVDPASPAAAQVEAVLKEPGGFPRFSDIPQIPSDLPASEAFKADVQDQEAEGLATAQAAAPETWHLDASDAFAARARSDAAAGGIRPPTQAEIAESEAFARAMRDRAKPPPRPR